jgi:hypothetical protein
MFVRREKLGGDPQIGQSTCWGCCRELSFLGVVTLSNVVEELCMWIGTRSVRIVCIRFVLHHVHWFESSWLSDMSNYLSCGCRQVVSWAHERMAMDWTKLLKLRFFANLYLISIGCSLVAKSIWIWPKYESEDSFQCKFVHRIELAFIPCILGVSYLWPRSWVSLTEL